MDTLSHKSVVNFIIVSTDLQTYVHDTRVKKGAELLTDHHLMVGRVQRDDFGLKSL